VHTIHVVFARLFFHAQNHEDENLFHIIGCIYFVHISYILQKVRHFIVKIDRKKVLDFNAVYK